MQTINTTTNPIVNIPNDFDDLTGAPSGSTSLTNYIVHEISVSVGSMAYKGFWTGTLAQYNALSTKDSNTLYFITS